MSDMSMDSSVRITLRDVYSLQQQTSSSVGDLVAELRVANERMRNESERVGRLEAEHAKLVARLVDVERKVWAIPSAAVVLTMAGWVIMLLK